MISETVGTKSSIFRFDLYNKKRKEKGGNKIKIVKTLVKRVLQVYKLNVNPTPVNCARGFVAKEMSTNSKIFDIPF